MALTGLNGTRPPVRINHPFYRKEKSTCHLPEISLLLKNLMTGAGLKLVAVSLVILATLGPVAHAVNADPKLSDSTKTSQSLNYDTPSITTTDPQICSLTLRIQLPACYRGGSSHHVVRFELFAKIALLEKQSL